MCNTINSICPSEDISCYSKVKLTTIVEGDPKAPFSIATTPRCRRGCYSFPRLLLFTLDPYFIMLRHQVPFFESLIWLDLDWKPRSSGPLTNTLTARPMSGILLYTWQKINLLDCQINQSSYTLRITLADVSQKLSWM